MPTVISPSWGGAVLQPAAILSWLFIILSANAFAAYFINQERFVYFWDFSGYWFNYVDFSASLVRDPVGALRSLRSSVRNDDYNLLPIVPLMPLAWLFGSSRMVYILAITNVSLLTAALAMGLLSLHIDRHRFSPHSMSILLFVTASMLTLHPMWVPVLRGLPDVLGVLIIGCILGIHFSTAFAEQKVGKLIATGVLLCLVVLLRRWYAYWVLAFFVALGLVQAVWVYDRNGISRRHYVAIMRNTVIVGLTFGLALFVMAKPFALRAITTDYSDIYSAYRHSSSILEQVVRVTRYFGLTVFLMGMTGLTWLAIRKETRSVGVFLIVQSLIIFLLFIRTQDFGAHHYYLLIPGLALGIGTLEIRVWAHIKNRIVRSGSLGLLFAALLLSSVVVFEPKAANIQKSLPSLVPSSNSYPLVRNDLTELGHLMDSLNQLVTDEPGDIYVLSSSYVLNSELLQIFCRLGPRPRTQCDRILNTNNVDKRDGFPRQLLRARYVVIASPIQYHLRPEDQRVVGILASKILEHHGVGVSFRRLPGDFKLDNEVTVWVFEKYRPFERKDIDNLSDEFVGYYPSRPLMFEVMNE